MDPHDGMLNIYMPITGTSTGDNGSASSATLTTLEAIALDYTQPTQRLWIWDNNRIRRIDLSTGVITTVIGGSGSDNNDTVNDPLQVRIDRTANQSWQNMGVFFADKDGKFYFQGYNDQGISILSNPSGSTRVKVYDPNMSKVTSLKINSLPNVGGQPTGNFMDCEAYGFGFEMANKVPVHMMALIYSSPYWSSCNWNGSGLSFIDMATGNGESSTPQSPIATTAWWLTRGRFVQGLDGNLYIFGKDSVMNGIWRYNKATADWTQLFGKRQLGYCSDGTAALSCASKIQDMFVSENGTIYFVDQGAIRTITVDGKVLTLFGQPFISGVNGPALSARIGTDLQVFHARTNGAIVFNELSSYKYFEFAPGGNLFHIAGDGTSGAATNSVDATTTGVGLQSDGDNFHKYFALDPNTGDIYHARGTYYLSKLKRSSSTVGASSQWENWLGGGTKSFADPTSDGTSDIGFSVNCDLNDDTSQLIESACQVPEILGFGGGKFLTENTHFSRLKSNGSYVYRNNTHKLYDAATKIQTNLVSTDTWTTNAYLACANDTSLDSCPFFANRANKSSPAYNPNANTWYITQQAANKVYQLTPGGTMQSFNTTQGINAIAYRDAGSEEYLYYCSSSSGQIRKYNLTTSTDTAMTWPVSSITCQRSTMEWNDALGGLVFIYKQDGSLLSGLALYHD